MQSKSKVECVVREYACCFPPGKLKSELAIFTELQEENVVDESHFCYHTVVWLIWHLSGFIIHAESREISLPLT